MLTVRQKVLAFIRQHTTTTAQQVSLALHMTEANARHHLAILEEMGAVECLGLQPRRGRGRPAKVYALAKPRADEPLRVLATVLLEELLRCTPHSTHETLLQELAHRIIPRLQERIAPIPLPESSNLSIRLTQVVEWLNRMHYQARWEARPGAPRILIRHCPFSALIEAAPQLCQMDAYLISNLCRLSVQVEARLKQDNQGGTYCAFTIG